MDLAPRLREEDKAEAYAASGVPVEYALKYSVFSVGAHVATVDGRPEMIFGCPDITDYSDPCSPRTGSPWMFCSPVAVSTRWRKTFVKHSAEWIDDWQARYGLLHNFTDARNSVHHAWLRRVGFTFIGKRPHGPFRLPFYEFVRIAPCSGCH